MLPGVANSFRPTVQDDRFLSQVPSGMVNLGVGACMDHNGIAASDTGHGNDWLTAVVHSDGSSPKCARKCGQLASCSGYMTTTNSSFGQGCKLFTAQEFTPASADGSPSRHCFWRHRYETQYSTNGSD